jgi:hypothetical protein
LAAEGREARDGTPMADSVWNAWRLLCPALPNASTFGSFGAL